MAEGGGGGEGDMDPLLRYFIIEILSDFLVMLPVDAPKKRALKKLVEGFSFLVYRTLGF